MRHFLLWAIILSAAMPIVSFADYTPPSENLLPEVIVHPPRTSYAQWLWFQAPSVARNADAFYRCTISLDEAVKSAWCYFTPDDSGQLYINGKSGKRVNLDRPSIGLQCHKYDLTNDLKIGKNVLAVNVHNDGGPGGIILSGEILTVSGKVIRIASAPELFKATGKHEKDWTKVEFDDSQWQPAMSIANADGDPWFAIAPKIWDVYGTAEEHQAKLDRITAAYNNYPDLSREKPAVAKVVYHGDMVGLNINGETLAPLFYMPNQAVWYPNVADAMVKSYRSGARILWYVAFAYQHLDAQTLKFDFEKINKDLKRILTLCPDAYIALNFRFDSMPSTWLNAHPDDIVQYASGKKPSDTVDQLANYLTVSSASETFRKFFADSMGEFARFAQAQDWGKRVVAMRSSFGVYSEWHYNGMQEDMPDTSPAMTRYFRNFLKDKYQTDAALAAAWHMPGVTLATAQVPGAAERQGDGLYLRDPASAAKQVMDYYECHQHANATMLLNAAREIKKVAPNWLVGAYYGYVFNMSYPSEGQTLMLDKVLSSPDIDFLSAPYTYSIASRSPGGNGIQRGLADLFRAKGKLALVELDVRTHKQTGGSEHNIKTESESVAVLQRDVAQAWVAGCGVQLLDLHAASDINNNSWFNSPGIQQVIHTSIKQWQELLKQNLRDHYDAVAVWHIDENIWHGLPTLQTNAPLNNALGNGQLNAIYRSGYAFDLKGLNEFLASKKRYKLAIFMNSFTLTDSQRAALKAKLRQDNTHAVFIYGAGAVRNSGLSAAGVTDLTGIKVEMETVPAIFDVKYNNIDSVSRSRIGDRAEAPRFTVTDKRADILGHWTAGGKAAAAHKQFGTRRNVWYFGAPVNDPVIIAEICKKAGLHRYTQPGVMMRTNGNIMLVHGGNNFSTTVTFPAKVRKLTDLYTGEVLGKNTAELQLSTPQSRTWAIRISK